MISIEELTMVYLDRKVSQKEERLWQAFTRLDKTGNMKLSLEDVKKGLEEVKVAYNLSKNKYIFNEKLFQGVSWNDKEIEEAFKQADLDGVLHHQGEA